MTERKLSELQKEYRDFFLEKLIFFGVKSPAELIKDKKSEFFNCIKQDWAEVKLAKIQIKETLKISQDTTPIPTSKEKTKQTPNQKTPKEADKKAYEKRQEETQFEQNLTKQVIVSEPNVEQTDDLIILFNPNKHFEQDEKYLYPVVKMPKSNSNLKLPRLGRSNQKGYKEDDFYTFLQFNITELSLSNNFHLTIPNHSKPYEPDFVLYDKKLNLYVNFSNLSSHLGAILTQFQW